MTRLNRLLLCLSLALLIADAGAGSLRFFGNGVAAPDRDRVKIRIDAPAVPADVGAGDFTLELWLRADPARLAAAPCVSGGVGWINGHIAVDRDIYGDGDYGDFGLSVFTDAIAFGIETGAGAQTLCAPFSAADGEWHHVAVTRQAATGALAVYVDGARAAGGAGPMGDASYRDGRTTAFPDSDPFLVLGAEKHDAGPAYPSFAGWMDELRLSTRIRYAAPFPPPTQAFETDPWTAALYHFDESAGTTLGDSATQAGGPSPGVLQVGGMPAGPVWSPSSPISGGRGPTAVPLPLATVAAAAVVLAGLGIHARGRRR